MSKRLPNGRNDGFGRYVRHDYYLLKTEAWRSLDGNARAVYVEIKFRYNGSNNGRIPYSIREGAGSLRISKATAARALLALEDRGFILPVRKGHFDRKQRHASEWYLAEYDTNADIDDPARGVRLKASAIECTAMKWFARWTPPANSSQETVPLVRLSVPLMKPNGPSGETVKRSKAAHGP
jgi:hypothetical protein